MFARRFLNDVLDVLPCCPRMQAATWLLLIARVCTAQFAVQVLRLPRRGVLLLCAPQNFSCDTLCTRLLAAGVAASIMLRLMDPRLPPNRVVRQPP